MEHFPKQEKSLSSKKSQKGQALVEFALVLPIFLLVLIGIFDVSRMVYTKHAIDKAVREGARQAAVEINGAQAVTVATNTCNAWLATYAVTGTNCQAQLVNVGGVQAIQVNVNDNFQPFFTGGGMFDIFPAIVLNGNATMRKEG